MTVAVRSLMGESCRPRYKAVPLVAVNGIDRVQFPRQSEFVIIG
ncbi:hypothetical protein NJ7G_0522 [Natrinema sp. J7-2]|nr:hypothetical protein NJ7G_0522 [Natrinema sp. J7-2]